jgi:hypothetical protein
VNNEQNKINEKEDKNEAFDLSKASSKNWGC